MTPSIFPVGHYTGTRPDSAYLVRIGWQQHHLTEDAFATWVLGHGTADIGKQPWTEPDLLAAATDAGIADALDQLKELTSLGLLIAVPERSDEFAKAHRLDVQYVGLGNSPQYPEQYAVGLPGIGAAAILDPNTYELWQWGSLAPTLWDCCQVRASVTSGRDQPIGPDDVVDEVLGDLRFLLVHGCAYVDVADPG